MHTSNQHLGRSHLSGVTTTSSGISSGTGANGTGGKMIQQQQHNGASQNQQVSMDANVLVVEEQGASGGLGGGEPSSSSSNGYDGQQQYQRPTSSTGQATQMQSGQGQYQKRDTTSAFFPERSKYLEEYTRNVRTPRAQSARMSSGHSQGQGQSHAAPAVPVSKTTEDTHHPAQQQGGLGGENDLDVFDCLPLSAWSDDTLIGLPTSYMLYDKFQQLSTRQHEHQRASSAKPSEKRRHAGANRLISSSKGPRRTNMLGHGSRATTPTKQHREFSSSAQKHRLLSRDRDQRAFTSQLNHQNHLHHRQSSSSYEQDREGEEENSNRHLSNGTGSSTSGSISEWPNSLRIVVPMKLKTKQRPSSNPNLHSYQTTSGTRERDRNNYYGYHSKPNSSGGGGGSGSHNAPSIPSALRVQQQRNREEKQKEKERSAALAKAKLLSNYRNRHHQKVHENEEPLVISKASQIINQKQSWRKYN